jgi:hypothetical protein
MEASRSAERGVSSPALVAPKQLDERVGARQSNGFEVVHRTKFRHTLAKRRRVRAQITELEKELDGFGRRLDL